MHTTRRRPYLSTLARSADEHGVLPLLVPVPWHVWERLHEGLERLNGIGGIDLNAGLLSMSEYVTECVIAAVAWGEPLGEALTVDEGDCAVLDLYANQGAVKSIREALGLFDGERAALVRVFQNALALPDALDLPRERGCDVDAILRLQGSKKRVADWLVDKMPRHHIYVDVFGGTAAVLGAKNPSRVEVYNDRHAGIVNVWRVLREQPEKLCRALELTPYARVAWAEAKERDCPEDPVEWARRILVRSWQGYGGDWQKKSNGWRGGASMGASRTSPVADWEGLPQRVAAWAQRMRGVALESLDALELIKRYDSPDTLFYCDPPYLATANNYEHGYNEEDHRGLAEALRGIKGKAMISGYDSPLYAALFAGWTCHKTTARANRGVVREECVWLCPRSAQEREGRLL